MYGFLVGEKLRKGDHMEDPELDGRLILNWIFKKWHDRLVCLRIGTSARAVANAVMNVRVP
jgi:hypothetical protein